MERPEWVETWLDMPETGSGEDVLRQWVRHLEASLLKWHKANVDYAKAPHGFVAVTEMDKIDKALKGLQEAHETLYKIVNQIPK